AMHAKSLGLKKMIVPAENSREAAAVEGLEVYGVSSLREAVELCVHPERFHAEHLDVAALLASAQGRGLDFLDVKGQESAKRALVIAAAGNHNLLMVGSPGVGKSLIANRIPGILPPLSLTEAMEVTKLYSIAGLLPKDCGLVVERPFRAPHHTVSDAGLLGGGQNIPRPGEITLAHRGVLFLDELPEFRRNVLEALRQPLENGMVTVARASGAFEFPCRFMLVAAMNPCPCGYFGAPGRRCHCSIQQVKNYRSRLSGPLLDRIDLHVEVPPLPKETLTAKRSGPSSAELRSQILAAREIQRRRFQGTGIWSNSDISGTALDRFCTLTDSARKFLDMALNAKHLSARSYDRILRVARTCADLNGHEQLTEAEVSEACQYRVLDQELQASDPWS
ncbi:MAG: YifB family Mg chelatase-like AAA ATPase, partial [Victivallales bacterium]|nr:YifB family Mg chelatase-like AAA ATPase [Victivallales bacterium]